MYIFFPAYFAVNGGLSWPLHRNFVYGYHYPADPLPAGAGKKGRVASGTGRARLAAIATRSCGHIHVPPDADPPQAEG